MKQVKVLIARDNGKYRIKVEGRANFECSPPLRNFAHSLECQDCREIFIDLSECVGMDSTFMGILAMMGLKAKKCGYTVNIVNADVNIKNLLNGLGLQKIFNYVEISEIELTQKWEDTGQSADKTEKAETVLEAHETLMKVDKENIPKFKNVVDFVKKDLGKEDKPESK
ncbi:MAG: STAS domain-containing protein [Victivallales bacterium]